jgi:hypothetical protein
MEGAVRSQCWRRVVIPRAQYLSREPTSDTSITAVRPIFHRSMRRLDIEQVSREGAVVRARGQQ